MNVRAGVLVALLAAGSLAACGESGGKSTGAVPTTFRDEGAPPTSSPTVAPPTTVVPTSAGSGLLICYKNKWSLINPSSGASQTVIESASDCTASPPIAMGGGTTKYSTIFRLSTDASKYSAIQSRNDGLSLAGYIPINSNALGTFKDLSGYQATFSGQLVKDGNALFNPTTGDLWWQRDTKLFSAPATGGPPQDRGEGKLFLFTQQGEPMPSSVRESPSGRTRLVNRVVGTSSEITSACQQRASRDNVGTMERCTGASTFPGASDRINATPDCLGTVVGLIDDETLVCLTSNTLTAAKIVRSGATASLANERPLVPKTEQTLVQAALSADGTTAFFLARAGGGVTLYKAPTSGTATEPTVLTKWSETPQILGWVDGARRIPAWYTA